MADTVSSAAPETAKEELPKLSATEFKVYNSMAEHMDYLYALLFM